jgi:hypothetical protein
MQYSEEIVGPSQKRVMMSLFGTYVVTAMSLFLDVTCSSKTTLLFIKLRMLTRRVKKLQIIRELLLFVDGLMVQVTLVT